MAAALALWAEPGWAANDPEVQLHELTGGLEETAETQQGSELVFMPIPMSNPTVGTGGALAVMNLFYVDETAPVSNITVGGMYTNTQSWGVGALASLNFKEDRFRLRVGGGYFDMNLDLYGMGNNKRLQVKIPINERGTFGIAEGLWLLGKGIYIGPRLRYLSVDSSLDVALPPEWGVGLGSVNITSTGPGLRAMWDTRDNQMNPSSGFNLDFKADSSLEAMGSDRSYQVYRLGYSHYMPLDERRVLASRVTACRASDGAPFYDICLFGSDNALRGYVGGQYRDEAMFTMEAEYRWRFGERFGMVAFAGLGQVAPNLGGLDWDNTLHSVGAGLRFLASKKHGVNMSVDWAFGKDSDALYFYIGESF